MPLVTDRLKAEGVPFETLFHQSTFHAADEAHRLGVPLDDVVKTILITTRTGHALVVIPASCRLDMHLVGEALGDPHARLASEAEISDRFPTYPMGALPPLSSELDIPIYVDAEVASHEQIVFAASKSESVRVRTDRVLSGPNTSIAPLVVRTLPGDQEAVAEEVYFRASIEVDE